MKKILSVFTFTYLTTLAALTAADSDIVKGFDFTGSTSVTGAKLNQLVDNSYVGTNRGMIIFAVTNSAGAVASEPKLARYIWLDSSFNPPVPKVWSTSGFWTNITAIAAIAAGSVTTTGLADDAVTTLKIADGNVTVDKLGGNSVNSGKIQVGSITNAHLANGTLTSLQLAANSINSSNIVAAAVTGDKIAAGAIGVSQLTNGFALQGTNIAAGTITSVNIATNGVALTNISMVAGTSSQVLRVDPTGTALQWATDPYVFVSTNLLMTAGQSLVVTNYAHGLGGIPDVLLLSLVVRADNVTHSYPVGSLVPADIIQGANYRVAGFNVTADGTSIVVHRYAAGGSVIVNRVTLAEIAIGQLQVVSDFYLRVTCIKYNR